MLFDYQAYLLNRKLINNVILSTNSQALLILTTCIAASYAILFLKLRVLCIIHQSNLISTDGHIMANCYCIACSESSDKFSFVHGLSTGVRNIKGMFLFSIVLHNIILHGKLTFGTKSNNMISTGNTTVDATCIHRIGRI
jgi:hypothetical protein